MRLDIEKITPLSPAGTPIFIILESSALCIFNSLMLRRHIPSFFIREIMTSAADIACEIIVAIATPSTVILKHMTNIRLKMTFIIPASVRK